MKTNVSGGQQEKLHLLPKPEKEMGFKIRQNPLIRRHLFFPASYTETKIT